MHRLGLSFEGGKADIHGRRQGGRYTVHEKGVDNLWLQPLDSSPYRQLTHFTSERIAQFAFSPDGSQIAFERGHTESDAVLLRDVSR